MREPPIVIVLMGVSGSGKTTLGRLLARRIGCAFHDADSDHSPENVARMRKGEPLDEAGRRAWIKTVAQRIAQWLAEGSRTILACSALTAEARRTLAHDDSRVAFVHLEGEYEMIRRRMKQREHFMPPALLRSQFEILELPAEAILMDVSQQPEVLVERIRERLGL